MNCPVCLSPATAPALTGTDFLFATTTRTFNLSACAACRSLFLDPLPQGEEIAAFYPTQYWRNSTSSDGSGGGRLQALEGLYRRFALRGHVAFILQGAGAIQQAGKSVRILDVGCGTAMLLGLLRQRGFEVLGVDMSAEASEIARVENGVKVVVGSLHDAQLQAESFDLITLFHVMEHVTNPREVLAEVQRLLKPGGRLILQVPNIESWQFRLFGPKWYGLDIPRHVIDYSSQSMQRLLTSSGFSVRRIRHFNLRDNAPALASSLFPSLDPVSRAVRQRQNNVRESSLMSWLRHLMYLTVVILSYPFALLESAAGSGATIMIEASRT